MHSPGMELDGSNIMHDAKGREASNLKSDKTFCPVLPRAKYCTLLVRPPLRGTNRDLTAQTWRSEQGLFLSRIFTLHIQCLKSAQNHFFAHRTMSMRDPIKMLKLNGRWTSSRRLTNGG